MALLDYLTTTNFGIISVAVVIFVLVIIAWRLYKKSQSGRIGIESQKIAEDEQLLDLDTKIRRAEKTQKRKAKEINTLFEALHKRAGDIGFDISAKLREFEPIKEILNTLVTEKTTVTQALQIVKQFNTLKNNYLFNFPAKDTEISDLISQINSTTLTLYNALTNEYNNLRMQYGILKKEESQTLRELAA